MVLRGAEKQLVRDGATLAMEMAPKKGVVGKLASFTAERVADLMKDQFFRAMDNMIRIRPKTAHIDIFKLTMEGWFEGISDGSNDGVSVAAEYLHKNLEGFKPGPECPVEIVYRELKDIIPRAMKFYLTATTTSESDMSKLLRVTVEYAKLLDHLHITLHDLIGRCKMDFLVGPIKLARAAVPYGTAYWAKKEFRDQLRLIVRNGAINNAPRALHAFRNRGVTASIGEIIRYVVSKGNGAENPLTTAYYERNYKHVQVSIPPAGLIVRTMYEGIIHQTDINQVSDELQPSLSVLKEFYNATKANIEAVYDKAARMNLTLAVTTWQNRKLTDIFDDVRRELWDETPASFSRKMLLQPGAVLGTMGVTQAYPPPGESFFTADNVYSGGVDMLLTLDKHVSQAGFNWLAGREACRLDKPSDQARCASCWSFAVTGALDYRLCGSLLRNNLPLLGSIKRPDGSIWRDPSTKLSNQVCLSCTTKGDCNGGSPADCIDYIKSSSVTTHSCVPYTSWSEERKVFNRRDGYPKGTCPQANTCPAGRDKDNTRGNSVTILNAGYVMGIANIKAALASGPVTFVINTPATFLAWGGQGNKADGVFSSLGAPTVDGAHSNHIMVAFGWGVVNGVEVLLVLNSWGAIYNQFTFMGMTFNKEVVVDGVPRGPWLLIDANDPALGVGKYPAFWVTPGLRIDNNTIVPVKDHWK